MESQEKVRPLWIFLHVPKTGGTTFSQHLKKNLNPEEFIDLSHKRYSLDNQGILKNKDKLKVILGHASYYGIHKFFSNREPRYIVFFRDPAERIVSAYNFEMRTKQGKLMDFWNWYRLQSKNEVVHFMDLKYRGKEGTKINAPGSILRPIHKAFFSKRITYFFQKLFKNYFDIFSSSERTMKHKLDNAKNLLDRVYYIGYIPELNKDLGLLFKKIGAPTKWENDNVTEKSKKHFKLNGDSREKIYLDNKYDKELFDYAMKLREIKK